MTLDDAQPLLSLPVDILQEAVREGEARLLAQLTIATAADQRALTLAGFQVTAATGALTAATALSLTAKPPWLLAFLALQATVLLVIAAFKTMSTVRPAPFDLPGNKPEAWLPERWLIASRPNAKYDMHQAKVEQCCSLTRQIDRNERVLKKNGRTVTFSIELAFFTIVLSGAGLTFLGVARFALNKS